jgi:hypothetical protein
MKKKTYLASACAVLMASQTWAGDIPIQSRFPPLQFTDSTPGGAHPVGGGAMNFINEANKLLGGLDTKLVMHVSGGINAADKGDVLAPIVKRSDWGNLTKAVAAGSAEGGLTAYMGLPTESGLAFSEFYAGGVPFGLTAPEFISFLYGGGGLELFQEFYDEAFDGKLKVIPVAVSPSQTSGFFPEPLPEAGDGKTAEDALGMFCDLKYIIRYPIGAQYIIQDSCRAVGKDIDAIGRLTRCEDSKAACGTNPDNPVINDPKRLTFGGFAPGVFPHAMYHNGNVDAFELAMPSGHLQFFKLVSKKQNEANETVDVSDIIPPIHYLTSWQQTWVMTELVYNKAEWDALDPAVQTAIEFAARSSILTTYAQRNSAQGDALQNLERNGSMSRVWPAEMLETFASHADGALDRLAQDEVAEDGDDSLVRMLGAMRGYLSQNAAYFDADDISQGSSN